MIAGLPPDRHQGQLGHGHALLDQRAGVQRRTEDTAVEQRNTQINEVDKASRQAGSTYVDMDVGQGLHAVEGNSLIVQPLRHFSTPATAQVGTVDTACGLSRLVGLCRSLPYLDASHLV